MIRMLIFVIAFLIGVSSAAPLVAQSCTDLDIDAAIQHGHELTTLLKVANFRADVKYMGEIASELEQFLSICGDETTGRLALVCDYDCHLQLGRYRLFLASDLPFLSSAGGISRNDSPLSPQKAQDIGRLGLEVVERGLKFLARQQGGGSENDEQEASYRNFVRQLVGLNALKIQLLMAAGDTWYQTVSEARIKQLDFLLSEALNAVGGSGLAGQPNLSKAYTQYEAALWTLVETKMDIPGESTYDELRTDLLLLESDLQERMESVRKGYLFLNIDPLQFTTISFEELEQRIEKTQNGLEALEAKVESIVERWHANKQGEATRELDEERTIRNQEINLAAHRIGKIEHEARIFANTVQKEINAVDAERDTFGFRQQIRNLEFQLASKIAEFENQRKQLNNRRELDLIVLSKEAEIERRNEIRWLLNWEMTRMNLELQISSIDTQLKEYDRQIARNNNQREQLVRQGKILQTQIQNAEAGIVQADANIAEIETRRTDIFAKRRAVMREEICNIESQLAFIGEVPDAPFTSLLAGEEACQTPAPAFTRTDYVANMCGGNGEPGLREKLINEQIRARAFVMKCVVGDADADFSDLEDMVASSSIIVDANMDLSSELAAVECGSFTQSETDFAKQIYEAEKRLLEKQSEGFKKTVDQINFQIAEVIAWAILFDGSIIAAQTGLTIAETALAVAASVPETTVAAAGLASGVYTNIKIDKGARDTVNALRSILSTTIQLGRATQTTTNQVMTLHRQLTQIKQANEQIDYQKALKSVALHRTHFQLAGRRAEGLNKIKEFTLQNSIAAVECDSQELGIDEQVSRLTAEHTRLLASMDLQASENELMSFELATQNRQIERYNNEIDTLGLELEKLQLSDDQLAEDNSRLDQLVSAAQGRLKRVRTTEETVTGLASESQKVTNVINELRERQRQQMLALNDNELSFVESRIANETANTEKLVSGLNEAVALGLKSRELQAGILEFQGEVLADVKERQEELTDLVSQIDDPAERRNLFIANQETLAGLMKGIPEYIVGKRRSLETANLLLHLMRRRFSVVQAVTGVEENWPSTYVRNATQLAALVNDIADKRFFDERPINIDVARIVIPANSGFIRKLALTEAVEFEISPFAATEELMRDNGFFALWDNKFSSRRNMTLIDIFIGVQYSCTGEQWNRFTLTHSGSGMVFRPLTEGSSEVSTQILVGPERSKSQTFWNLADSRDRVKSILYYWTDTFQARKFPRLNGPPNDTTSILPYLGAPLIGSYRVSLQPSDCPFDGAVFTLYFIFASEL